MQPRATTVRATVFPPVTGTHAEPGGDVFGSFALVILVLRLTALGSTPAWPAWWAAAS